MPASTRSASTCSPTPGTPNPNFSEDDYLGDVVHAVFERIRKVATGQVVGGLSSEQAKKLAKAGLAPS